MKYLMINNTMVFLQKLKTYQAYQGSEWSVHLMLQHQLNILEIAFCKGSSYLPLSKELDNSVKGLVTNIQSECKEGFVWYLVGYFNPVNINPTIIRNNDREFVRQHILGMK